MHVSSNAELIGGNYTNVTSDIGAQQTHRLLHHLYPDAGRQLGHLLDDTES